MTYNVFSGTLNLTQPNLTGDVWGIKEIKPEAAVLHWTVVITLFSITRIQS